MRVAPAIVLTVEQKKELTKLSRSNTTSVRLARRAKIVLLSSSGYDNTQIAEELGVGRVQVGRWRERYARDGLAGIEQDLPRGGRKPTVDAQKLVHLTTQTLPDHATHWSTRTMAKATDVGATTVRRIWQAHGLKPHLIETFKVSRDPEFIEKLEDVVGLYLSPPEHALVLCCDAQSASRGRPREKPGSGPRPHTARTPLEKGACSHDDT